ncbi:Putative peptidoglycan binding domain-containing protein [Andreprevotia lacus DSM 23236]|jgi:N-acetylmuramoyl-L-alanine amidase|uniref:Putative peptidoglycan binding domain-containing protein n=1 Tax=Andreprevotia lacus DSM 23236 TaxID=1121001 RepID=A0A1W1X8N3_9NEIS|nr:peptidoglycan-binding domain-containing protein [Andreprevotia lacus]SMC20190.1 Putative peptidoglycan binding domain-containing protein [Andreprevotia lacus DSM 23236]
MSTRRKIVPGDSVSSIAAEAGLAPDTVWQHADNQRLRDQRDHMDVLAAGDTLVVPAREAKEVDCATGQRHRFRRHGVPVRFSVQLLNMSGQAMANRPYKLVIDGALTLQGDTDGDGMLSVFVPPAARRGTLAVDGVQWPLAFGHLEPDDGLLGAQQRLSNLGFACLHEAGTLGPATRSALRRFQLRAGLAQTGKLDGATRDALARHHREPNAWREQQAGVQA